MKPKFKFVATLRNQLLPVSLVWFNFFIAGREEAKSQEATNPVPTLDAPNEKAARQALHLKTPDPEPPPILSPAEEKALKPFPPPKTPPPSDITEAGRLAADETVAKRMNGQRLYSFRADGQEVKSAL